MIGKPDWHPFKFRGGKKNCDNLLPHAPHAVDQYNTVRYGWLDHFCPGMSGNGFRVHVNGHRNGKPDTPGYIVGEWTFDPMGECTHILQQVEDRDYQNRPSWKIVYQEAGSLGGHKKACTVVEEDSAAAWRQARMAANFHRPGGKVISVDKIPAKKITVCVDVSPRYVFTGIFDKRTSEGRSLILDISDESGDHYRNHAWLDFPVGLKHGQQIKFCGSWKEHISGDAWAYGPEDIELLGEDGKPLASQCGMGCA